MRLTVTRTSLRRLRFRKSKVIKPAERDTKKAGPTYASGPALAQQAIGNQAVQRMLQAKLFQAKLTVNPPDDKYEKEADQVADTVMRMPEPLGMPPSEPGKDDEEKRLQTKPLSDQKLHLIQREEVSEDEKKKKKDEEKQIQTKSLSGEGRSLIQREADAENEDEKKKKDEEKKPLQTKPLFGQDALIHREVVSEDEENKKKDEEKQIQTKSLSGQSPSLIQREAEAGAEEDKKRKDEEEKQLQTKLISEETPSILDEARDEKRKAPSDDEERGIISRKIASDKVGTTIEETILQNQGQGQTFDPKTRTFFEPRFGQDFSGVRVHTDTQANETAQALNAQAFTTGQHIYFGAGRYHPGTREGSRLLAHELTHVVQQGAASSRSTVRTSQTEGHIDVRKAPSIQRQATVHTSDPTPSPTSITIPSGSQTQTQTGKTSTVPQGLPPEAARQLLYATTTLKKVKPLDAAARQTLQKVIPGASLVSFIRERDLRRMRLNQAKDELISVRPEHGVPMPGSPVAIRIDALTKEIESLNTEIEMYDRLIQAGLRSLNIDREESLVTLVAKEFPRLFITRGKQIAKAELEENKRMLDAEMARYGVNPGTPADRIGLRRAAQDLLARQRDIDQLQNQLQIARTDAARTMPSAGVPDPSQMSSSYYDVQRLPLRIQQKEGELQHQLEAYKLQYPILLQNFDLSAIATSNDQQLAMLIGGKDKEIRDNIEETKRNIDSGRLQIWNLRNIVEMTTQDLGVGSNTVLMEAVNSHIRQAQTEKAILDMALAALAITAGIVATVASGGLALAAGGVVLGVGGYTAYQGVRTYMAESAASNVALDPRIADISKNEPDLFWMIVDLAGVGLDASQVVRAFNQMRNAARALRETGGIGVFVKAAHSVGLPAGAAERLILSASQKTGVSTSVTRTIKAIGAAFRQVDMAAITRQIEQLAGRGYANVFKILQGQGRVHSLTKEALEAVYGRKGVAKRLYLLSKRGFYDPNNGHIFIREGQLSDVASTVIHEATHWLQDVSGPRLDKFFSEFQAYSMEREFLKRLEFDAGRSAVPGNLIWLLDAADADIAAHVSRTSKVPIPSVKDGEEAVRRAFQMVGLFK